MSLLDTIWETWNSDPAFMNSLSGILSMILVTIFTAYLRVSRKNNQITVEVGDVKQIIPIVERLVKELETLKQQLDAMDKRVEAQSDMFYTTFSNTRINAIAKDKLREQYLFVKSLFKKLNTDTNTDTSIKEVLPEPEPTDPLLEEVEAIYQLFKGSDNDEGSVNEEITN